MNMGFWSEPCEDWFQKRLTKINEWLKEKHSVQLSPHALLAPGTNGTAPSATSTKLSSRRLSRRTSLSALTSIHSQTSISTVRSVSKLNTLDVPFLSFHGPNLIMLATSRTWTYGALHAPLPYMAIPISLPSQTTNRATPSFIFSNSVPEPSTDFRNIRRSLNVNSASNSSAFAPTMHSTSSLVH